MITRFAPSPTGPLHLGHAYSALIAQNMATAMGGQFLLRIEDIDQTRVRPEWEAQIFEDLHWLGLSWPQPVMRQSERLARYSEKLDWLWAGHHVFACTCSRRDVLDEFTAEDAIRDIGDIVLARRDMGTSYHLSVVLDDAAQDVTHVVRGEDLFEATKIHVILQKLMGLPTPIYHHHQLIRDGAGKRLAKRDDARAIAKYRTEGASPDDVRRIVGL